MPAVTVGDFRVFVSVDNKDFGLLIECWCSGVSMKRAKALRERYLIRRSHCVLVAKEQNAVFSKGIV